MFIYYIADPSLGRLKFEETEFKRHWYGDDNNGIAIIAKPEIAFYENITWKIQCKMPPKTKRFYPLVPK